MTLSEATGRNYRHCAIGHKQNRKWLGKSYHIQPAAAIRFSGETLRLTGRGTVSAFYRLFAKLLAEL